MNSAESNVIIFLLYFRPKRNLISVTVRNLGSIHTFFLKKLNGTYLLKNYDVFQIWDHLYTLKMS